MRNDIARKYFDWLVGYVGGEDEYSNLLNHLFQKKFYTIVEMDENRVADGLKLREAFYSETLEYPITAGQCSVLEVLISLALRCDIDFMQTDDGLTDARVWFWVMIDNLGLKQMTNSQYDYAFVEEKIDIFLNREYDEFGHGSIFPVENPKVDMRDTDIWYQMCWYLDEHFSFDI